MYSHYDALSNRKYDRHMNARSSGRPRDPALDAAILVSARQMLREAGVDGVTYEAVAALAGTTRPALYRRYPTRLDLVIDALASLGASGSPAPTGDPFADLVAELSSFRAAIVEANSITLVGSMLMDATDEAAKAVYRERIVQPRRTRLARLFAEASRMGSITGTPADQAVAVTMCTGSWYAYALAGQDPPRDWARRTARLVWRSVGGA
jgi:AcrR family transcriptional regulator